MRKRKANPSLEPVAGPEETSEILGGGFIPEPREPTGWVSRPTELPARGQPLGNQVQTITVDVATGGTERPPNNEGVDTPLGLEGSSELAPTGEIGPTPQEGVLSDKLVEDEADVAGEQAVEPHWFWELLEQAGYDVW